MWKRKEEGRLLLLLVVVVVKRHATYLKVSSTFSLLCAQFSM